MTFLAEEASTVTCYSQWPLDSIQHIPLHGSNTWGKLHWLCLDISAGLQNYVIAIFLCLSFLVYTVVATYCSVSHGALKLLRVLSSRLGKSWLCVLISVSLLPLEDNLETSFLSVRVLNLGQPPEIRFDVLGWLTE